MSKKLLLPLLAVMIATPLAAPNALAKQHQRSTTPTIWFMGLDGSASGTVDREQQAIKNLIKRNIDSVNKGDSQGYLKTLSTASKEYRQAAQDPSNIKLFKELGLSATVQQFDYIKVVGNQAEVQVRLLIGLRKSGLLAKLAQRQNKTKNPQQGSTDRLNDITSKPSTGVIKLTKTHGKWLISSMAGLKDRSTSMASSSDLPTTPKAHPVDKKTLQKLFAQHLNALNQESLPAYLATLDPQSPHYAEVKAATKKLFKDYDLKYELQKIEVISQGRQDAVVKMVATVRKLRGGNFTDSKMVTYNTVRRNGNKWLIYDTQLEKLTALADRSASR